MTREARGRSSTDRGQSQLDAEMDCRSSAHRVSRLSGLGSQPAIAALPRRYGLGSAVFGVMLRAPDCQPMRSAISAPMRAIRWNISYGNLTQRLSCTSLIGFVKSIDT